MERENDSFQKESAFQGADFQVSHVELQWNTWRIIPVSKWLVTPLNGHLERVPKLGDLRTPCFLTTYKSWDDPPSTLPFIAYGVETLETAAPASTVARWTWACCL